MSVNRLGKGLEALIRSKEDQNNDFDKNNKSIISEISINDIITNPNQPRKFFDKTSISELKKSIKNKGVITPITVRKIGSKFEVVAGERRYRVSKSLNNKSIPAFIINVEDDLEMLEIALIENIQREDLNPIELAQAYATLHKKFKMSHSAIAKSLGKSRAFITNTLRLLKLPKKIIKSLMMNDITAGHARAILQLKIPNLMFKLWKKILSDSLSVRQAEALVKEFVFQAPIIVKKHKRSSKKNKHVKSVEDNLIEIFGTKVKLKQHKEGGVIEINYFSNDDLDRLIDLIETISK